MESVTSTTKAKVAVVSTDPTTTCTPSVDTSLDYMRDVASVTNSAFSRTVSHDR